MLSSNMLLLNLILLIDVTFSTPTPVNDNYPLHRQQSSKLSRGRRSGAVSNDVEVVAVQIL